MRHVSFLAHPDDEIEVTDDFGVWVDIGPVAIKLPTYEFACQVEVAFIQARALLEPVNEPDAVDVAVADVDRRVA